MKLIELFESQYQDLYHSVTFDRATKILSRDFIRGSRPRANRPDEFAGVSVTRNKKLWFGDEVAGAGDVTFVLDQNKLRQKFKVVPFDYFNPDKYGSSNFRRREAEEKVLTEKLPLGYVKEIWFRNLDEYQIEELEMLIDILGRNIPIYEA